jgi:hypothetical protein
MRMITEDEASYHLAALYRWLSARPYRVLYVGLDLALLKYLEDSLDDCWIVRAPAGCVARPLIEHLRYSLLLCDETLMDTTARELTAFVRALANREDTPLLIINNPDDYETLALAITRRLLRARSTRPASCP